MKPIDLQLPMNREETINVLLNIQTPLLEWYSRHARQLPWRSHPIPYWVWLSEIMLQQTRVDTVLPYFERFINAIPNIQALADASEEQLYKLWEGLGYYSRVRYLHTAAKQVITRYDGKLPPSYELLLDLCGIGEYTAGAIASIAFGEAVPAVDGNVIRVIARVLKCESDSSNLQVRKLFRQLLFQTMPQEHPGDFNQAIMDLGAGICLPNGVPRCENCPLKQQCLAFQDQTQQLFPVKPQKKKRRKEQYTVFLICTNRGILLRKRPEKGLLAGMWEFPNEGVHFSKKQAERYLREKEIPVKQVVSLQKAKHIFTHIEWDMRGYLAFCTDIPIIEKTEFVSFAELETKYAIPSAFSLFKNQIPKDIQKGYESIERSN